MTFRSRLTIVTALAVTAAVIAASLASFFVVRNELYRSVDKKLQQRADTLVHLMTTESIGVSQLGTAPIGPTVQIVAPDGVVLFTSSGRPALPVTKATQRAAAGTGTGSFFDSTVARSPMRILLLPLSGGGALEIGTPLGNVNRQLHELVVMLAMSITAGLLLAVGLGMLVTKTALLPLDRLTSAVEKVADTTDLSYRIRADSNDELGRLASRFDRLMEVLERSRNTQHQLVEDAAHELRTPLTSLRTNVEVLKNIDRLGPAERELLIDDVLSQAGELTDLIGGLVELSRTYEDGQDAGRISLDILVAESVERSRTHARTKGCSIVAHIEPCYVNAISDRLQRAVSNLLDNAVKWSPNGAVIEVSCRGGEVAVRDHGPGIAPADLPQVFDRFYRAPGARGLPGSGLGLSIAKQVVEDAGGHIVAENPPGGGAMFRLVLPCSKGLPGSLARDPALPCVIEPGPSHAGHPSQFQHDEQRRKDRNGSAPPRISARIAQHSLDSTVMQEPPDSQLTTRPPTSPTVMPRR